MKDLSDKLEVRVKDVLKVLLDRRLIVLGAQADEVFEQAFAQLGSPATEAPAGP